MPSGRSCSVAVAIILMGHAASAEDAVDFKGKTVTVVASFEAGGPYDFYARLVARYIGAHLPGGPNVIVQNMPGAGGLRGANTIYNVAVRDGTVMGVVSQTIAVGQVLGTTSGLQYDAASLLGSGASTRTSKWSTAGTSPASRASKTPSGAR
jgi:tripartite-type tricarboxylate transporter receptor subunit TctC